MTPTTLRAIRNDFIATIQAIAPTYPEYRTSRWRYVRSLAEVSGPEIRTFHLEFETPRADFGAEGLWNGGFSYTCELRVHATYGDIPFTDDELLIEEDASDLYLALEARVGQLDGLISVAPLDPPFGVTQEQEGTVVGFHRFEVRFFRRDQ